MVWPCGKIREKVCGKESYGDGSREEEERKTQEEVKGLYKRRPESYRTGRSQCTRLKKVEKIYLYQQPHLSGS